jgi:hypothetical protein
MESFSLTLCGFFASVSSHFVTEAFSLQPDLHVFLCHLFGIYVDPYISFNTLFCFCFRGFVFVFFWFQEVFVFLWGEVFVPSKMARKKIREYDSKRILKEHIKRIAGISLGLKSAQVCLNL